MARRKYFGTDGMRGAANTAPIQPQTIQALAMAAGTIFQRGDHKNIVVIGKDTRLSGYMLETALTSGFLAMGMDVLLLGPLPTPAIAMLTKSMRAELGVMISASHNPYQDNGIKLFGPDGYKLSDESENQIAIKMDENHFQLANSNQIGRAQRIDDAPGRYIEFVKSAFPSHLRLDGLKLVVDCAHGSAYKIAPLVLKELGAEVIAMGVDPDGTNINEEVGATHPTIIAKTVLEHQADLGIALDGDADRLILIDETGTTVDGDQILAIIAKSWQQQGRLNGPVIATILSNLGLELYLNSLDIEMKRCPVGDRHVVAAMKEHKAVLGGEASGHIVLGHHATTGDGLLAALQVLSALLLQETKMSVLAHSFIRVPQIIKNIRMKNHHEIIESEAVKQAIAQSQTHLFEKLGTQGRLIVRPSGTENLIRIMIEGSDEALITQIAQELSDKITSL